MTKRKNTGRSKASPGWKSTVVYACVSNLCLCQRLNDALKLHAVRRFDEHAVARLQQLRQCREQRVERVKRRGHNGGVRRSGTGGDIFRQLSAGDHERHTGLGRADAGLAVQGRGVRAELAHVAENGHPAA